MAPSPCTLGYMASFVSLRVWASPFSFEGQVHGDFTTFCETFHLCSLPANGYVCGPLLFLPPPFVFLFVFPTSLPVSEIFFFSFCASPFLRSDCPSAQTLPRSIVWSRLPMYGFSFLTPLVNGVLDARLSNLALPIPLSQVFPAQTREFLFSSVLCPLLSPAL